MKLYFTKTHNYLYYYCIFFIMLILISDVSSIHKHRKSSMRHNKKNTNQIQQNKRLFILVSIVILIVLITLTAIVGFIMLIIKTKNINEDDMKEKNTLTQSQERKLLKNYLGFLLRKARHDIINLPEPENDTIIF